MSRCDPVEMRKNLQLVSKMKAMGMDFVPVPVDSVHEKQKLLVEVFETIGVYEDVSENGGD